MDRKTTLVLFLFKRGTCRQFYTNRRSNLDLWGRGFSTPESGERGTGSLLSQRLYSPSFTTISLSAGRSWKVCFSPLGQMTSRESIRVLGPNPKLTR